jgi:hypothetical protein
MFAIDVMATELFSTEHAFRSALALPFSIGEAEKLSVVDLSSLSHVNRNNSVHVLGTALAETGIVLIRLSLDSFPQRDPTELAPLLTGEAFESVFDRIFLSPSVLSSYFREPPPDGAENAFYSFPLNSRQGGIRGKKIRGTHAGLPTSLIWSHSATENLIVDEFIDAQATLSRFITLYREITNIVIGALAIYFADDEARFNALAGSQTHHRANHLKLIYSPGASVPEHLDPHPRTAMICRHRPHVDHCILTLNPPTDLNSTNGGQFYYLSPRSRRWCWRPLMIPAFHVAIFGGVDLSTFTEGSGQQLKGLAHQVFATSSQAVKSRRSALYRVAVDPDASDLCRLDGRPFSFHDIPTPTGRDYYQALFRHRQGTYY